MLAVVFEVLLYLALIFGVVTQLLLPLIRGTPVFPAFHSRERQLESALAHANEDVLEAALEKKAAERRAQAAKLRSPEKNTEIQGNPTSTTPQS